MALLEVNGIGKSFGATAVLRDISLTLAPGERLGLGKPEFEKIFFSNSARIFGIT